MHKQQHKCADNNLIQNRTEQNKPAAHFGSWPTSWETLRFDHLEHFYTLNLNLNVIVTATIQQKKRDKSQNTAINVNLNLSPITLFNF